MMSGKAASRPNSHRTPIRAPSGSPMYSGPNTPAATRASASGSVRPRPTARAPPAITSAMMTGVTPADGHATAVQIAAAATDAGTTGTAAPRIPANVQYSTIASAATSSATTSSSGGGAHHAAPPISARST